jgi:hypothetical protein
MDMQPQQSAFEACAMSGGGRLPARVSMVPVHPKTHARVCVVAR